MAFVLASGYSPSSHGCRSNSHLPVSMRPWLFPTLLLVDAAHSLALGQLPRVAAAIASGAVHVEPDFLSGKALEAARAAADELRVHSTAAVVGGGQDDTSAGVAIGQIDTSVRDCATLSLLDVALPLPLIDVLLRIDALRADLAEHTNRPLLEGPELQLLHYPAGGHYRRHVDEEVETSQRPVRRSISRRSSESHAPAALATRPPAFSPFHSRRPAAKTREKGSFGVLANWSTSASSERPAQNSRSKLRALACKPREARPNGEPKPVYALTRSATAAAPSAAMRSNGWHDFVQALVAPPLLPTAPATDGSVAHAAAIFERVADRLATVDADDDDKKKGGASPAKAKGAAAGTPPAARRLPSASAPSAAVAAARGAAALGVGCNWRTLVPPAARRRLVAARRRRRRSPTARRATRGAA